MADIVIVAILKDGSEMMTETMDEAIAKENLARIHEELNTSNQQRFVKLSDTISVEKGEVKSVAIAELHHDAMTGAPFTAQAPGAQLPRSPQSG